MDRMAELEDSLPSTPSEAMMSASTAHRNRRLTMKSWQLNFMKLKYLKDEHEMKIKMLKVESSNQDEVEQDATVSL